MNFISNHGRFVVAAICAASLANTADAFRAGQRWTSTATNGGGLTQGTPTTLTWSFVPDGTVIPNEGNSDIINFLDTIIGAGPGGADLTQRPWFPHFANSFDRWSQLTGLSYVYEPNDDGITGGGHPHQQWPGALGVRGDVRISGNFIDGASNVLAYNFFPNNGDMVIDTGDGAFFGTAANTYRRLRNTVMHEHGHGIGLNHVESSNAGFLMEPFLSTTFDGPQLDDILGGQRLYGDFYEKSNGGAGNNTFATAIDFGLIAPNTSRMIGQHAVGTPVVLATETDFISIDDDSDLDYFSFTVDQPSNVNIVLTPAGATYNEGAQGGAQAPLNTAALSDLTLRLYDTDGTTLLISKNDTAVGLAESIASFALPSTGEFFVRVSGAANNIQMYTLNVNVVPGIMLGDFNADGLFNCADIDSLVAAVASGSGAASFDLNGDTLVNAADVTQWLALAGAENLVSGNPYLPGDVNLDGGVDGSDFNIWNANKFTSVAAWCSGDLTADGAIDGSDFNVWNSFKFQSSDGPANAVVPEPSVWTLALGMGLLFRRRRCG